MLRQLYPILLSITVALAIGVYLQPGEARKWLQQAGQWGGDVLSDTLRATAALADGPQSGGAQAGYASTNPAANPATAPYPSMPQDPAWTYVANGNAPAATLGAPVSPPSPANGYYQTSAAATSSTSSYPNTIQSPGNSAVVYPRVLANGSNSGQPNYPSQPASAYPGAGQVSGQAPGSPYPPAADNPLRPSMSRQAPWAAQASGPSAGAYQEALPDSRVGGAYPKVQWAGDWRDYRGVPETVKPSGQSQYGYLPPPDIDSTVATVDRYLPNQPAATAATAAPQPAYPGRPAATPNVTGAPRPQSSAIGGMPGPQGQFAGPNASRGVAQNHGLAQAGPAPASSYNPVPYVASATPSPTYPQVQAPLPTYPNPAASASPYGPPTNAAPGSGQPAGSYPYAPAAPQQSAYPNAVSGYPTQATPTPRGAQMESPDPVASFTLCEGAQILARVGSEVVLASEVLPTANQKLSEIEGVEKGSESEIAMAREHIVRGVLPQQIDLKLVYVDAKRSLPQEVIDRISQQIGKGFEEVEVSNRLKKLKLNSRRELEEKLAEWGTSLELEKRAFIEQTIARQWMGQQLSKGEEATHEELLDYYHAHATEYEHPTRVRWEHLEVTFSKHSNKREAWQLIAAMGNAVQQGRPFSQVATERSEGLMASKGGQRDWLTEGSLKSAVLDKALFALPAGSMSPILEDETGFHIVRVVEREDAYRTPFVEVQGEIREQIQKNGEQAQLEEYVLSLRDEIPVWTVFDKQTADSRGGGAQLGGRF